MTIRAAALVPALLLGLAAASCGGSGSPSQAAPGAPAPPAPSPSPAASGKPASPQHPVAGGYTTQDPASPEIQTAAAKAVELLKTRANDPSLKLGKVLSAETQVVAGLNYRLRVELGSASGPQTLTLTLYRDLQGGYQLTAVER